MRLFGKQNLLLIYKEQIVYNQQYTRDGRLREFHVGPHFLGLF